MAIVYGRLRNYGLQMDQNSAPAPPIIVSPTEPLPDHLASDKQTNKPTMSAPIEEIEDDEQLYKMMSATDNFDERRRIRNRLKDLRTKRQQELEARRASSNDLVKQRAIDQEETKRKKMEKYAEMARKPTCENMGNRERHSTTAESKTNPDGSTTIITTTNTDKSNKDILAEQLATKIQNDLNGSQSRGRITVKTETWNSKDGLVQKSETTQRWGAKPQGPRGAMAAFKQMDSKTSPTSPTSPNLLAVPMTYRDRSRSASPGGRSRSVSPSVTEIKNEILNFCSSNTTEYENVNITNFSGCWSDGLAFCALIHHFYPDAFEYGELKPENRRSNFTLAFDVAEQRGDIAPLLDVEDMVIMKKPDWKCVFTYVQSLYRHLRDHANNKAIVPPPSQ